LPTFISALKVGFATMDAATIAETNRLRVAMGMKPLPVPGEQARDDTPETEEDKMATYAGRMEMAYENERKLRDAEEAKKKREEKAAAIKKARDKAQRLAVLSGTTLADDEDGEIDAKAWLKGQKKRQKKIEKTEKSFQEREAADNAAVAAKAYTAKDLEGVRVGHKMSALIDGDEHVLTLKDSDVLGGSEDEADELENVDLRDQEKLKDRLDLKKKKVAYDPNDIDETGQRGLLSQYDEEIFGKKKNLFTLDGKGSVAEIAQLAEAIGGKQKVETLSLDILDDAPASDYLDPSKVKVKKPKKKKSKATRQRNDEDSLFPGDSVTADLGDEPMEGVTYSKKRSFVDDNLGDDDDDLQATLSRQRLTALKKRKKTGPEALARQLKEEAEEDTEDAPTGLVVNDISAFVDGLRKDNDEPRTKVKKERGEESATAMQDSDDEPDRDVAMADTADWNEEGKWEEDSAAPEAPIEEEQLVDQGIGATMSILRQRGLIEEGDASEVDKHRKHVEFVSEKRQRLLKIEEDARRQRERDRPMLERLSERERQEYSRKQNASREFQASKAMQDMFNQNYTPNFIIKYTDEHGRSLDKKEAWKHLSHQFHGKQSGNAKTAKQLKKIEQEKKEEAKSLFDGDRKSSSSSAAHAKKRKDAGVRLG
jgi:U4/U6.U5 tri-snRNP-associated protein 1